LCYAVPELLNKGASVKTAKIKDGIPVKKENTKINGNKPGKER